MDHIHIDYFEYNGIHFLLMVDTVTPVYRGHLRDHEKVSDVDRCPLIEGFLSCSK